jgi:Zn-dependent protease
MHFPNPGVFWVAVVGLGLLVALALFDGWFIRRSSQPVGRWVQAWARRFPVLAFVIAGVFGTLYGHFYWSTPPICPTVAAGSPTGTDPDCTPPHPSPPTAP